MPSIQATLPVWPIRFTVTLRQKWNMYNKVMVIMKQLSLLLLAALSAFTGRAQNPWISLYDQSIFDLSGKTAIDTICIPVRLENGLSLADVQPSEHPSFVRLNGQSRQVYVDAMRIGKSDGPMPLLRLVVNIDLLTESGAYQAIFSLTAPNHSRLDISLTLNRVAVKLDTVHRIAIHIDGTDIRYDPFMVRESGSPFDIKSLFISPPYMPGIKRQRFHSLPSTAVGDPGRISYLRSLMTCQIDTPVIPARYPSGPAPAGSRSPYPVSATPSTFRSISSTSGINGGSSWRPSWVSSWVPWCAMLSAAVWRWNRPGPMDLT